MAYKGKFRPRNPSKYKGDPTNIIYRSLWECKLMSLLDSNPNVLEWSSEEVIIPYLSPIDNKWHRYFVDFYVKKKTVEGEIVNQLIEVKPAKECKPPKQQKTMSKQYLNEVKTWGVNSSKWEAARKYCDQRNWQFSIYTEKELGIK